MRYFRIHTSDIAYKTNQPRGLFVAVWKLVEEKLLTDEEEKEYWENREYFEKALPVPPFYDHGNPDKAVTWFKDTDDGKRIYEEMSFYRNIAKKYGLKLYISECEEAPGEIIYEDAFQIAVINQKSDAIITTKEIMEYDCCFTEENNWFRYRAAAIIIEEGCVLLVGNSKEDYYYSVGGGVHMNEKAEDAVIREVYEETGVHYSIDRLAVIHENFWNGNGAYDKGLSCHEIAFYFLMKPRGTKSLESRSYTRFGDKETMLWIPVADLGKHKIFPSFLKEYLTSEHEGIRHIITDDRKC